MRAFFSLKCTIVLLRQDIVAIREVSKPSREQISPEQPIAPARDTTGTSNKHGDNYTHKAVNIDFPISNATRSG